MIAATLASLLSNEGADFDLLVIDQSDDDRTRDIVAALGDPRLRYIATATRGLSKARNLGLREAASEIVLMTDDDCTVPPDWVAVMHAAFDGQPTRGVVFCDVNAAPFDPQAGFIPGSTVTEGTYASLVDAVDRLGMGAGFAIRKSAALDIGGFDVMLGAGARFQSGEEHDLAYRMMLAGFHSACIKQTHVVHHGFRTFAEGRDLIRNYAQGHAAIFGKLARCGLARQVVPAYLLAFRIHAVEPLARAILQWRRPFGFNRLRYFMLGFFKGLLTGADRRTRTFVRARSGR